MPKQEAHYHAPTQVNGATWVRWAVTGTLTLLVAVGAGGFQFAMSQRAELAALKQQVNDKIEADRLDRQMMLDSIRHEFDLLRADLKEMQLQRGGGPMSSVGPTFQRGRIFDK